MALTRPGRAMLDGIGDAAEKTVGTDSGHVPTNANLLVPTIASQVEAEAGTEATKRMTALRTAQAIAALGLGPRRGGALDLSSGTGGTITDLGGIVGPDLIEIWFNAVSVDGSNHLLIQIGDSGGVETSGYQSASGSSATSGQFTTATTGLVLFQGGSGIWRGMMKLCRISGNIWTSSHAMQAADSGTAISGGGTKTLTGTLDRIAIAANGANNFDGGGIQIFAGLAG